MAYETGTGTLQAMLDNLATFALANGWSAHDGTPHRYWSILGRTRHENAPLTISVDFIKMAESAGGANVLSGGTASATSGDASAALVADGTPWTSGIGSFESRWTYDFGLGNEKSIVEVTLTFPVALFSYRFFELQFSDDGSSWTTLKSFRPGIVSNGETFVGLWTDDNWPLSPGGENFVDFILNTGLTSTGFTTEGGTFPITDISELYVNVGKDRLSPLTYQGSTIRLPLLDIDEWHFFADETVSAHVNVAFRITYRDGTFWHHLSAGEIDKKGMTHNGAAYCTTSLMCSMVEVADGGAFASARHHTLDLCGYFGGRAITGRTSSLCYRLNQTGSAFPYPDDSNFPTRSATLLQGDRMMPTTLVKPGAQRGDNQFTPSAGSPPTLGSEGWQFPPHPTTGFVTLGVIPMVIANSTSGDTADVCWLGEFPNVRTIRLDNIEPGAEVDVGSDTWMCFPVLRKVSTADGVWPNRVAQSGPAGIAYKKVVV